MHPSSESADQSVHLQNVQQSHELQWRPPTPGALCLAGTCMTWALLSRGACNLFPAMSCLPSPPGGCPSSHCSRYWDCQPLGSRAQIHARERPSIPRTWNYSILLFMWTFLDPRKVISGPEKHSVFKIKGIPVSEAVWECLMNEVMTAPAAWEFSVWKKGQVTDPGCAASAQSMKQDVVLCVTTREVKLWSGKETDCSSTAVLFWSEINCSSKTNSYRTVNKIYEEQFQEEEDAGSAPSKHSCVPSNKFLEVTCCLKSWALSPYCYTD